MKKNELIESTKRVNMVHHEVAKRIDTESDHICMICKNSVTSFCNSHSIPHSVFNHMNLENGEIIPAYNAAMEKILTKTEKGKNNSGIFKLICNDCDQKYFFELDNFDIINGNWNNKLLKLQAQRINLYQIYRLKENLYTILGIYDGLLQQDRIEKENEYVNEKTQYYRDLFYRYDNNKKEEFKILFDDILDYEANFATVTALPMIFNPCLDIMIGNYKADIVKLEGFGLGNGDYFTVMHLDDSHNNIMYAVVLPYNGKTRITLFCDSNSICAPVIECDFGSFSKEKKLLYISSSIMILGRNVYGNSKFKNKYRKFCEIYKKQFVEKYNGRDMPEMDVLDIKEGYLYAYDNGINLFEP